MHLQVLSTLELADSLTYGTEACPKHALAGLHKVITLARPFKKYHDVHESDKPVRMCCDMNIILYEQKTWPICTGI